MNTLVRELWAVFVLVIISDGIAAFFAGKTCWRLRNRAQLAWPLALFMFAVALVDLNDMANIVANGVRNTDGIGTYQALGGRVVRSAVTWYLALKLMNGYSSRHTEEERDNATYETNQPVDNSSAGPGAG